MSSLRRRNSAATARASPEACGAAEVGRWHHSLGKETLCPLLLAGLRAFPSALWEAVVGDSVHWVQWPRQGHGTATIGGSSRCQPEIPQRNPVVSAQPCPRNCSALRSVPLPRSHSGLSCESRVGEGCCALSSSFPSSFAAAQPPSRLGRGRWSAPAPGWTPGREEDRRNFSISVADVKGAHRTARCFSAGSFPEELLRAAARPGAHEGQRNRLPSQAARQPPHFRHQPHQPCPSRAPQRLG